MDSYRGTAKHLMWLHVYTSLPHSQPMFKNKKQTCLTLWFQHVQTSKWRETTGASITRNCRALYTDRWGDVLLVVSVNLRKKKIFRKVEFPGFPWVIIRPKGLRVMREFCVFSCPGSKALKYTTIVIATTSKTHNPLWAPNISFTDFIYSRHWCQV